MCYISSLLKPFDRFIKHNLSSYSMIIFTSDEPLWSQLVNAPFLDGNHSWSQLRFVGKIISEKRLHFSLFLTQNKRTFGIQSLSHIYYFLLNFYGAFWCHCRTLSLTEDSSRFESTWGWVNNIFFLEWTIPLG